MKKLRKIAHKVAKFFTKKRRGTKTGEKREGKYTWILDAGHGGLDQYGVCQPPEKRSPVLPEGKVYYEGVGNRIIIKKALSILNKEYPWVNVVELCQGDKDISLKDRVEHINELHEEIGNTVTISQHSNKTKGVAAQGVEVYSKPKDSLTSRLKEVLYSLYKNRYSERKVRARLIYPEHDKEDRHWMLQKVKGSSVLIESFFMNNPQECQDILMDPEEQGRMARIIVDAIIFLEQCE